MMSADADNNTGKGYKPDMLFLLMCFPRIALCFFAGVLQQGRKGKGNYRQPVGDSRL